MQKHTTWRDELDPIDTGMEDKTVEVYLAADVETLLQIVDRHFGYPERGPAVDETCMCGYCQYARVRSLMDRST